jgi:signal transduction histidine kinase
MKAMTEAVDLASLQFMGKVVAAFSHDFKNALAIINENAGLLKDLTAMAAHGRPADPARLETLADRIGQQVQRADEMARLLNRFAHSADKTQEEVDLSEMLVLAAALSRRPAALQRIALEIAPTNEPLRLTIFAFGLQHLLYECLQAAMAACGPGGEATLCATSSAEALKVEISTGGPANAAAKDVVVPEAVSELAAALNARLENGGASLSLLWERVPPTAAL